VRYARSHNSFIVTLAQNLFTRDFAAGHFFGGKALWIGTIAVRQSEGGNQSIGISSEISATNYQSIKVS